MDSNQQTDELLESPKQDQSVEFGDTSETLHRRAEQ